MTARKHPSPSSGPVSTHALRVGLVQMCSGPDAASNLQVASERVREAARAGAAYVQTPEVTTLIEPDRARMLAVTPSEAESPAVAAFRDLARDLTIWLHIGSMAVKAPGERLANRSLLIGPDGEIVARFDKIHMFDVDLPGGESYRESRTYAPGDRAVVANTPWGGLGMTVCYDLRFPHLYRALAKAGAHLLAVPAAFTVPTGQAHWETLLRARAIETQCFVLAAAQTGTHHQGRRTWGHSLVVSPWGEVIADGGSAPGIVVADLDLAAVSEARARIPSLDHDRPFVVERVGVGGVEGEPVHLPLAARREGQA